jgi:hypothetical protein
MPDPLHSVTCPVFWIFGRVHPGASQGVPRVIIPTVDSGLETLLRDALPLPATLGDVSFDPPSGTWSAQLSRITVNLFLFGVGRSSQPPRPAVDRLHNGRAQRRPPIPMIELHYLVSAWAGTVRDEHQLVGEVLTQFLETQILPARCLPEDFEGGVQLAVAPYDNNRAKDVWATVGGAIKPSFELVVTTATDALPYVDLPPAVERIRALLAPIPAPGG